MRSFIQVTRVNISTASTSSMLLVLMEANPGSCLWVWPMRSPMDLKAALYWVVISTNRHAGNATAVAPLDIYGVMPMALDTFNACSTSKAILLPLAGLATASTFFQTTRVSRISIRVPLREKMCGATRICRISMLVIFRAMESAWFFTPVQICTCLNRQVRTCIVSALSCRACAHSSIVNLSRQHTIWIRMRYIPRAMQPLLRREEKLSLWATGKAPSSSMVNRTVCAIACWSGSTTENGL